VKLTRLGVAAGRLFDSLTDALTDLEQRDRSVLVVLGAYLLTWTLYGVIAKGSQDLHTDMTELIVWSRDLALGYPKHPPFAAIVVRGWFALFPHYGLELLSVGDIDANSGVVDCVAAVRRLP
jgi:hypothetical protein